MTNENETTPTDATTTFAELLSDPQLISGLAQSGITKPSAIQGAAIPHVVAGRDLIAQAQTGSGKTLAFMLPILEKIRATGASPDYTVAIIITPTRELANQVRDVVAKLAPDIQPACIIGGMKQSGQVRELQSDARIIVGTPGRLLDLLNQREINLRKCTTFVLDEADEMLSMGFLEEVTEILSKLPKERQGMFFSATITNRVLSLAYNFLKDPVTVTIENIKANAPDIEHLYFRVPGGVTSKASALCDLIEKEKPEAAIIFCNTKSDTELVEVFLRRRGFDARRINSDLPQKDREKIMNEFKAGELKLLIATDVAARGIDVAEMDLVINYSIHDQVETYVHRTGRTGRAGRSGKAVSIIGPLDHGAFYGLTRHLPLEFKEMAVPVRAVPA